MKSWIPYTDPGEASDFVNAIKKLVQFYNGGKPGDVYREAAGQLINHIYKLQDLTIYELADICYTSPTTLSRLCRRLGFLNFVDFKNSIASDLRRYDSRNRIMPVMPTRDTQESVSTLQGAISESLRRFCASLSPGYLDEVVTRMGSYDTFAFYSNFPLDPSALQQDLLLSGKRTYHIDHAQAALADAGGLTKGALVISFLPHLAQSEEMLEPLKAAKAAGADLLLLSAALKSPFDPYADYLFSYNGTGTAMDKYVFLFFLDMITLLYRQRYIDAV